MKIAKDIYRELKVLITLEWQMRNLPVCEDEDMEEHEKRLYCLQERIRVLEEVLEVVE